MLRTRTLVASAIALGIAAPLYGAGPVLASGDPSATAEPGSMTDLSKSERDAFRAKAAEVAKSFADSAPPANYVDPDPSSTVNPHPELAAVERYVEHTAPGRFAGAYEDERGVIHVGLIAGPELAAGASQTTLPNVELVAFDARHSWSELVTITDEITDLMASQPALFILSAGPDVKRNLVTVGVTDVESPAAKSLIAKYGDVVSVFKDDALELRAVAPGRNRYRNPVLGGLNITSPNTGPCTSGFTYGPPIRQDPTGTGEEVGVITAGHCLVDNEVSQEWFQGGRMLGTFTRHRYVNGSTADVGTISTIFGPIQSRRVTNGVFLSQGVLAQRITARLARGAGRTGDIVLVSGARSGLGVGSVATGGAGRSHTSTRPNGQIVTIRNVYSAIVSNRIVNGDSGAPVFNGTGVAFGIVLGSARANQRRMFYSQITNAEFELGVTTCTGRPSPRC